MRNLTIKFRGCVLGIALALMSTVGFAEEGCNTGTMVCCSLVVSPANVASVTGLSNLLSLLGINVSFVAGSIGQNCVPTVFGAENSCTTTLQCCSNNSFNGIVALGCAPYTPL